MWAVGTRVRSKAQGCIGTVVDVDEVFCFVCRGTGKAAGKTIGPGSDSCSFCSGSGRRQFSWLRAELNGIAQTGADRVIAVMWDGDKVAHAIAVGRLDVATVVDELAKLGKQQP